MPDLASPEWAEEVGTLWPLLPEAPGAEGTVSLAFGSAPRREVAVHWRYAGGRPVEGGRGTGGDPQLSLTLGPADVQDVLSGTVPADVAFMRGRLKASGEGGLLLAFLASTSAPAFEEWRTRVAGVAGAG